VSLSQEESSSREKGEAVQAGYRAVMARIAAACERSDRSPEEVTLVAVSKRHPPEAIEAAYAAGARDFGENYMQELVDKRAQLAERLPEARWHFIGRVQRNKAAAMATCELVHGAGKLSHLAALGRAGSVDALLQVNISEEETKGGLRPEQLRDPALYVPQGSCRLRGLMCIPAIGDEGAFQRTRVLRDEIEQSLGVELPWLSMGMTSDFEAAIAAGATHVRVGTAIFGERPT
jgi:pyridoxal phosphate enzyme (YggS family)